MRSLRLAFSTTIFVISLAGQDQAPAPPVADISMAPIAPGSNVTTKPGMFWGTVIRREQFEPLTGRERWRLYWRQAYWSPGVYFRAAAIAGLDQNKDIPGEWGQGLGGYARRLSNEFARAAVKDSLEAAAAAALRQDVRYVRCQCNGVWKRAGYAIGSNFATLNSDGNWEPAYARLGAAVGAQYLANTWMPPGYRKWSTSLRDGGLQFGFSSAFNLLREFVPIKKR